MDESAVFLQIFVGVAAVEDQNAIWFQKLRHTVQDRPAVFSPHNDIDVG
jgi:hypothetical protein